MPNHQQARDPPNKNDAESHAGSGEGVFDKQVKMADSLVEILGVNTSSIITLDEQPVSLPPPIPMLPSSPPAIFSIPSSDSKKKSKARKRVPDDEDSFRIKKFDPKFDGAVTEVVDGESGCEDLSGIVRKLELFNNPQGPSKKSGSPSKKRAPATTVLYQPVLQSARPTIFDTSDSPVDANHGDSQLLSDLAEQSLLTERNSLESHVVFPDTQPKPVARTSQDPESRKRRNRGQRNTKVSDTLL